MVDQSAWAEKPGYGLFLGRIENWFWAWVNFLDPVHSCVLAQILSYNNQQQEGDEGVVAYLHHHYYYYYYCFVVVVVGCFY